MPVRRAAATILLICLILLGLSSCAVRRRVIPRLGGKPRQALRVADKAFLIREIANEYAAIHDFNATVDMTPALGSAEKNKITEYKDIRAYILFRKPAEIRIVGLYPVIRGKAFDMVSNGQSFKLYIPSKNRFVVGRNEVMQPSANKLENMRPEHFLSGMLVRAIANADATLIENYTDEDNAFYILYEVAENGGVLMLKRAIWFSRIDLMVSRQMIFDADGNIVTDASYSDWQTYDNVPFPRHIKIDWPRDEYGVVMDIVKMDMNKGVPDDRFVLTQPEGTTLQVIGEPPEGAPPPGKKTS